MCTQGALAAAIARATDEAMSVRTFQRGIGELAAHGFVTQRLTHGKRRQYGPDDWTCDPICVYTLTDKAIAYWSDNSSHTTECRSDDLPRPEFFKTQIPPRADVCSISGFEQTPNRDRDKVPVAHAPGDGSRAPSARNEGGKGGRRRRRRPGRQTRRRDGPPPALTTPRPTETEHARQAAIGERQPTPEEIAEHLRSLARHDWDPELLARLAADHGINNWPRGP
jgi:hypothetical protein